jgi:hypothetical protein
MEAPVITNPQSGTNIHEIADGIYRINTPVAIPGVPDQFNFNQYLIVDEAPLSSIPGRGGCSRSCARRWAG